MAWCPQDPDLLLSCGKDNHILCWNPNSSNSLPAEVYNYYILSVLQKFKNGLKVYITVEYGFSHIVPLCFKELLLCI